MIVNERQCVSTVMAEHLVSMKHLDDVIECPICAESYTDPRTLPCIHTFCLKCIAEWSKIIYPADRVPCPVCRKEFTIPENGIEGLPKSFFVTKLLAVKDCLMTPIAVKMCDVCGEDDEAAVRDRTVKMFCVDCQQSLCKVCCQMHSKVRATSHHRLTNPEAQPKTKIQDPSANCCDKHQDKRLEIYCFDCRSVVCVICRVTQHDAHKCSDVIDVADKRRTEMVKDAEVMSGVINCLNEKLRTVDKTNKLFVERIKIIEAEIREKGDELKALVDRHVQLLLEDLSETKTNGAKEIENFKCELMQNKSLAQSFLVYCRELLEKGSTIDIAREADRIHSRVHDMTKLDDIERSMPTVDAINVKFRPCDVLHNAKNVVGEFVREQVTRHQDVKQDPPTFVRALDGSGSVTAMTLLNAELFVKRSGVPELLVYNTSTLQLQRKLAVAGLSTYSIFGMASCAARKRLYISDYEKSIVHKVNPCLPSVPNDTKTNWFAMKRANMSTSTAGDSVTWPVMKGPGGLSVNGAHNVLVASHESNKIQEFTTTGSLVREISDDHGFWQALEVGRGKLAVSRVGPTNDVCVMTTQGRVVRSCLCDATTAGPMKNPRSMVIDENGFILVADTGNNRILIVDPAMTDARQLPLMAMSGSRTDSLRKPVSLCFDPSRSRLYVGEFDSCQTSRILVFDGVFSFAGLFVE